jgi:hypothetical protein
LNRRIAVRLLQAAIFIWLLLAFGETNVDFVYMGF